MIDHPYVDRLIMSASIVGDKKYYLYAHFRKDKQEAFYIGIATKYRKRDYDRAMCYRKRSEFWKRVANKTRYNVMILTESDDKGGIIEKEINYIKVLGKKRDKSGTLVNITDGGEGLLGHRIVWTEEMKNSIRKANSRRIIKESTRNKLRANIYQSGLIGRKGKDSFAARPVLQLEKETGEIINRFDTIKEAATAMKVSSQSISAAIKKGAHSCNFKWVYENERR